MDHDGAFAIRLEVIKEPLKDVFHRDRLVCAERLERRKLEEIAVFDLGDGSSKDAFPKELLEYRLEGLLVLVATVVVGVCDALIPIEDPILPVPGKEPDQVGLEVKTNGFVEGLIDDNPY